MQKWEKLSLLREFILSAPGAPFVRISGRAACKPLPRGQLCVSEYTVYQVVSLLLLLRWLLLCSAAEHVARLLTRRAARDAGREMMMHQEQSLSLCLFLCVCVCVSRSSTAESEILTVRAEWERMTDRLSERLSAAYLSAKRDSQGPISATAEALSQQQQQHSLSQRARVYC